MVYGPPSGFVRNKPAVSIDPEFCIGCGRCVRLCRRKDVLSLKKDASGATVAFALEPQNCAGCGLCLQNCPTHAVRITMSLRS